MMYLNYKSRNAKKDEKQEFRKETKPTYLRIKYQNCQRKKDMSMQLKLEIFRSVHHADLLGNVCLHLQEL